MRSNAVFAWLMVVFLRESIVVTGAGLPFSGLFNKLQNLETAETEAKAYHSAKNGKGFEVGYSKSRNAKGNKGYKDFESYHNKDTDSYGKEKHIHFGQESAAKYGHTRRRRDIFLHADDKADNAEFGYLKKSNDKGSGGYEHFESFHNKDGDSYGYETHEGYGEKEDEGDAHHGRRKRDIFLHADDKADNAEFGYLKKSNDKGSGGYEHFESFHNKDGDSYGYETHEGYGEKEDEGDAHHGRRKRDIFLHADDKADNAELGYLKKSNDKGSGGYEHFESFHNKDGDSYGYETHEGYGEKDDEGDAHRGRRKRDTFLHADDKADNAEFGYLKKSNDKGSGGYEHFESFHNKDGDSYGYETHEGYGEKDDEGDAHHGRRKRDTFLHADDKADNAELGYLKKSNDKGSGGYEHFESFHNKDGDSYGYETHEGYGEKDDEGNAHHGRRKRDIFLHADDKADNAEFGYLKKSNDKGSGGYEHFESFHNKDGDSYGYETHEGYGEKEDEGDAHHGRRKRDIFLHADDKADNAELGYLKKSNDKGSGGYEHFESFHNKDGDSYGYETHEGYGEKDDEGDAHHGRRKRDTFLHADDKADNAEFGYLKKSNDKGSGGYEHFESFHNKDGDSYGYETHEGYGEKDDEGDAHHGRRKRDIFLHADDKADNAEFGYLKKSNDKGSGGYEHFESFHNKDGDSYGYETHEGYGEKDDEGDAHHRRRKRDLTVAEAKNTPIHKASDENEDDGNDEENDGYQEYKTFHVKEGDDLDFEKHFGKVTNVDDSSESYEDEEPDRTQKLIKNDGHTYEVVEHQNEDYDQQNDNHNGFGFYNNNHLQQQAPHEEYYDDNGYNRQEQQFEEIPQQIIKQSPKESPQKNSKISANSFAHDIPIGKLGYETHIVHHVGKQQSQDIAPLERQQEDPDKATYSSIVQHVGGPKPNDSSNQANDNNEDYNSDETDHQNLREDDDGSDSVEEDDTSEGNSKLLETQKSDVSNKSSEQHNGASNANNQSFDYHVSHADTSSPVAVKSAQSHRTEDNDNGYGHYTLTSDADNDAYYWLA